MDKLENLSQEDKEKLKKSILDRLPQLEATIEYELRSAATVAAELAKHKERTATTDDLLLIRMANTSKSNARRFQEEVNDWKLVLSLISN